LRVFSQNFFIPILKLEKKYGERLFSCMTHIGYWINVSPPPYTGGYGGRFVLYNKKMATDLMESNKNKKLS